MNFLDIQGFDVKEGKHQDFQKWMATNEEKLALECPEGTAYKGTYAMVRSSHRDVGNFVTVFEMDSYAAQDRFSAAMKEGGTFARLLEEMTEYIDQRNEANFSQLLGRRVTDAAIWGD